MSCLDLYIQLGLTLENIAVFDSRGHVNSGREGLGESKQRFATEKSYESLADAMKGADVFLGLSKGGLVTGGMIKEMGSDPIVFALANPDPEIPYKEAIEAREDIIMATGRSDYPNQVNNVLGFPFLFRGALDAKAKEITNEMLVAAAKALADLAKEEVPQSVLDAYEMQSMSFGKEYFIPKPFDPRLIDWVAKAVREAA